MSSMDNLKSKFGDDFSKIKSDQNAGKPKPATQKEISKGAKLIDLPEENFGVKNISLLDAIKNRKSLRKFSGDTLSINELSFLLWATQGLRKKGIPHFRNVPSGGAAHPLETYLAVFKVNGLKPGLYRYLPLEHKLCNLSYDDKLTDKVKNIIPTANRVKEGLDSCAVSFIWTATPYRTEWRYPDMALKLVAQDAGHMCQNLYLAVEAVDAGMCAIDAYFQDKADALLGVDGEEEFTLYMAVVGKNEEKK